MDMEYSIRRVGRAEARSVAEVIARAWGEAYRDMLSEEVLARQTNPDVRFAVIDKHIEDAGSATFLAEKGGVPCGMGGIHPCAREDGAAEVGAIYILKSEWGRGAGPLLMDRLLGEARALGYLKIRLWVLRDNARARAFYEKCGFHLTGEEAALPMKAADGTTDAVEARYARDL